MINDELELDEIKKPTTNAQEPSRNISNISYNSSTSQQAYRIEFDVSQMSKYFARGINICHYFNPCVNAGYITPKNYKTDNIFSNGDRINLLNKIYFSDASDPLLLLKTLPNFNNHETFLCNSVLFYPRQIPIYNNTANTKVIYGKIHTENKMQKFKGMTIVTFQPNDFLVIIYNRAISEYNQPLYGNERYYLSSKIALDNFANILSENGIDHSILIHRKCCSDIASTIHEDEANSELASYIGENYTCLGDLSQINQHRATFKSRKYSDLLEINLLNKQQLLDFLKEIETISDNREIKYFFYLLALKIEKLTIKLSKEIVKKYLKIILYLPQMCLSTTAPLRRKFEHEVLSLLNNNIRYACYLHIMADEDSYYFEDAPVKESNNDLTCDDLMNFIQQDGEIWPFFFLSISQYKSYDYYNCTKISESITKFTDSILDYCSNKGGRKYYCLSFLSTKARYTNLSSYEGARIFLKKIIKCALIHQNQYLFNYHETNVGSAAVEILNSIKYNYIKSIIIKEINEGSNQIISYELLFRFVGYCESHDTYGDYADIEEFIVSDYNPNCQ